MAWSTDVALPNHYSQQGIGLAPLGDGKLICVHRGNSPGGKLWWTIFDGSSWGKDQDFPNHFSADGASLAVYNGQVHCVHRGGTTDDLLYLTVYDAGKNEWSADTRLPDIRSSRNPAIAPLEVGGKSWLVCVHRGWAQDDRLWFTRYDGHGWTKDALISEDGHHCYGDPALALYKGILYCVHRGKAYDTNLYCATFDGSQWSRDDQLPDHHSGSTGSELRGSVGLASDGHELYCVHKGKEGQSNLWWTHYNGATWSTDAKLSDNGHHGTFVSLAYLPAKKALYCVHDGGGDEKLWYTYNNDLGH